MTMGNSDGDSIGRQCYILVIRLTRFEFRFYIVLILVTFGLFYELKLVLAEKSPTKKCDVCGNKSSHSKKDRFYGVNVDREIVRRCFGVVPSGEENALCLCSSCYRALNKHKQNGKCFPEVSCRTC